MTEHLLLLAAPKKGIDLILPATAELVWGAICFAVVAFLLIKFAFPRIKETIEARERAIQGSHEEAERARDEAKGLLDDYKKQLAEARSEANRIIEEGRQSAEQVRKDLVARAETDAEGIVARARDQIQQERQRTIQELQSQIGAMSIELAEKVVGRSLDGATQRELVDAYINQVTSMGGPNGGTPSGGVTS
ncbi:MAG: F-type H+-transporting ATPase subunit b [Actinomycetota bacterium]|jgi:F-type H+-transporting ATPase subunit b|nr:F-type H+-transporting ATPase subunit b [Actinomycetota bacterium]